MVGCSQYSYVHLLNVSVYHLRHSLYIVSTLEQIYFPLFRLLPFLMHNNNQGKFYCQNILMQADTFFQILFRVQKLVQFFRILYICISGLLFLCAFSDLSLFLPDKLRRAMRFTLPIILRLLFFWAVLNIQNILHFP